MPLLIINKLRLLLLFVGLSCFSMSVLAASVSDEMQEERAKAVLLYNFIKQIQWTNEQQLSVIEVAYWGTQGLFNSAFDKITSEMKVRGKPLAGKHIDSYKSAKHYQVLVIGKQFSHLLPEVALYLTGTNTLLVSDGAVDGASTMVNYLHPKEDRLSFEVNTSNLRFEKLDVSSDILLYGGTEVEIVALYKTMEKSLLNSKKELISQRQKLKEQGAKLQEQEITIQSQGVHVAKQQVDIHMLNEKQSAVESLLSSSAAKLEQSRTSVASAQKDLNESLSISDRLIFEIEKNKSILAGQQNKIQEQSTQLGEQEETISSQRSVIVAILSLLLLVALYIVIRQKFELRKERQLSENKEALVKVQEESIDAYKSSLEAKNNFLTAINHELRTPMHLILGALHNISNDDKTSLQASLGIVEQGAEHMMNLISDILFYSELQSEKLEVNATSVDFKKQMTELCELYRIQAEEKALGFYVHFSRMVPQYLSLDVDRLCIVLEKLLDNAIKYTQEGEVVVNVGWQVQQGPTLLIQINDTGVGFSSDQIEQAFEPFEQSEAGLARQYEGLGIGLSICRKVMQLLGGGIVIDSDQYHGSSINLSLPVANADHAGKPPKGHLQLAVDNTAEKPLILVVEDNSVSLLVSEKIIRGLGYRCMSAANGKDALTVIKKYRPELVLMDLQMPHMDGVTCTSQLKQSAEFEGIPVVALTANAQDSIRRECISVGMEAVLNKPIDVEKLTETLSSLLSNNKNRCIDN